MFASTGSPKRRAGTGMSKPGYDMKKWKIRNSINKWALILWMIWRRIRGKDSNIMW